MTNIAYKVVKKTDNPEIFTSIINYDAFSVNYQQGKVTLPKHNSYLFVKTNENEVKADQIISQNFFNEYYETWKCEVELVDTKVIFLRNWGYLKALFLFWEYVNKYGMEYFLNNQAKEFAFDSSNYSENMPYYLTQETNPNIRYATSVKLIERL